MNTCALETLRKPNETKEVSNLLGFPKVFDSLSGIVHDDLPRFSAYVRIRVHFGKQNKQTHL
jgi:hypothetical protein